MTCVSEQSVRDVDERIGAMRSEPLALRDARAGCNEARTRVGIGRTTTQQIRECGARSTEPPSYVQDVADASTRATQWPHRTAEHSHRERELAAARDVAAYDRTGQRRRRCPDSICDRLGVCLP